ncbi:phosphotransferase [Pasteurella testudinis]|uniref:phosphotransferase n=1 Tax=Pasteurella testudinis TaxID=761 RepID=UPI004059F725
MALTDILQADFWSGKVVACKRVQGLSDGAYCVTVKQDEPSGQQHFLLRLQTEAAQCLGAKRYLEGDILFNLQALPFVPKVFYQGQDFLVLEWIDGTAPRKWNNSLLVQLAKRLQNLHHYSVLHCNELAVVPHLDLIQHIFLLLQQLPTEQQGSWLLMLDKLVPFEETDIQVVGHHDLHLQNLVMSQKSGLNIIDWEYASLSNPALELAFFFANNTLSEKQQKYFLNQYIKNNHLITQERAFIRSIASYYPWVKMVNRLWQAVQQSMQP